MLAPERLLWAVLSGVVGLMTYAFMRDTTAELASKEVAAQATIAAQAGLLAVYDRALKQAETTVEVAARGQLDCERAMALTYDRLGLPRPKKLRGEW